MRKLIISLHLASALALAGCATSIETRMLERGQLAEAYTSTLGGYSGAKAEDKNRVVAEILSKTGGAKSTKFKEMLSNYMENHAQNQLFFAYFPDVLGQGLKDGLISSAQHLELIDQLLFQVEKESIQSPSLLQDSSIKAAFPELGRYRAKIALGEFAKLQLDPNASLNQYLPIYRLFTESKDEASAQRVRAAMRVKAEAQLKASDKILTNVVAAQPIFEYIKLTGDRSLDTAMIDALIKVKLTRSELTKGDIPTLFPTFAKEKIEKSVIKLDITSPKDEFIVGEIIEELKKGDEWLEITDESKRKLTIGRIRFQEDRTNPTNMTETVQSPNFITLLMIPKNASVLFDYSTAEYSVQWNMSVTDSQSKGAKAFSGQRKGKKVECRNMRYQNVFGGTGSLGSMPNDAVANFCQSSANVDFDQIRAGAISEIASEISRTFLAVN